MSNTGVIVGGAILVTAGILIGKAISAQGQNPPPSEKTGILLTLTPSVSAVSIGSQQIYPGENIVNPGTYTWSAAATGYTPQTGTITVTEGQMKPLNITLLPSGGGWRLYP